MYTGADIGKIESYRDIPALLKRSQRVIMVNERGRVLLVPYPAKMFGGQKPVAIDIAFPVVHGTNVEDGALQGYLKTVGIPFVGPDVTSSAISMDKFITKAVLKEAGVPVLDAKVYTMADYEYPEKIADDIEKTFGYPVIIKGEETQPKYKVICEKDVKVPMRDGVHLYTDIYRPDVEGEKFPALLAYAYWSKNVNEARRRRKSLRRLSRVFSTGTAKISFSSSCRSSKNSGRDAKPGTSSPFVARMP